MTLAIDRAGLVGQDGPTHHGTFDLSYLRCIPIWLPSDENECRTMLQSAWLHEAPRPCATHEAWRRHRFRTSDHGYRQRSFDSPGAGVAILNFGVLLDQALAAAESLDATVVDMRWVKPLDEAMILSLVETHHGLITLEENAIAGGAGSGVAEFLAEAGVRCPVQHVSIPDAFIAHAGQGECRGGTDGRGHHKAGHWGTAARIADTASELIAARQELQSVPNTKADSAPSISQQMNELSELVEQLENPEIELEAALVLYEKGVQLSGSIQKTLESAEQQVAQVAADGCDSERARKTIPDQRWSLC